MTIEVKQSIFEEAELAAEATVKKYLTVRQKGIRDVRRMKIERARQAQPISELLRKKRKAERRGWWTQEDLDWAKAEAERMYEALNELG